MEINLEKIQYEIFTGDSKIVKARNICDCHLCGQAIATKEISVSVYKSGVGWKVDSRTLRNVQCNTLYADHYHILCVSTNPVTGKKWIKLENLNGYNKYEKEIKKILASARRKNRSTSLVNPI